MHLFLLRSCSCALLAVAATAQNPLQGFLFNWDRPQLGDGISYVTRGTPNAEEDLNRIDADDYRGFGLDRNGQVGIQGMVVWLQDDNDATRETFGVVGYPEDPARANYPDLANQRLNIGGIQMPPTGATPGGVAYELTFGFTQPVTFAPGTDLFLGLSLPAMPSGTPPYDGLWAGIAANDNTIAGVTTFDLPGPRGAQGGGVFMDSYLLFVINGSPLYGTPNAVSMAQLALDVNLVGGTVGGVALARTNQTSYPSSNAPYATSNFLSGSHPDVSGFNAGRADDIGFGITAHPSQVAAGSPALVLVALGPNNLGTIPVSAIGGAGSPDSAGFVCVDLSLNSTAFVLLQPNAANNMLEGQLILPLSQQVRSIIAGRPGQVDLHWQGFVLDASAGGPPLEVRATGCAVQHLK